MVEVAQRLMKYSRLATPEAVKLMDEKPSLLDDLVTNLEKGEKVPMFIQPEDLKRFTSFDIKERKETNLREDKPASTVEKVITRDPAPKPDRKIEEKKIEPEPEFKPSISKEVSDITRSAKRSIPVVRKTGIDLGGASSAGIPLAKQFDPDVKVIKDPFEHMGTQGKIEDFMKLFQSRYRKLKAIMLAQYGDLSPCDSVVNLSGAEESVRFIGIVNDTRTTKNGHTMLEVEDPTGRINVLLNKNKKELSSLRMVHDEVVGVVGNYKSGEGRGRSIVFADKVYKVDFPGKHRRRISEDKDLLAVFTSDIHIGSKMYLGKEWNRMVGWLKGEKDASLKARDGNRVKYFVVAGDLVDGIGIYPDQDKDLIDKDITKQYESLAESLAMIPDHIEVILMPGNHDAVRLAEPQPPLPDEFQELFSNSNIHFLSNPSYFSISGVQVAGYHGKSIDDMVTIFKDVTYESPIEGLKEMLRSRHYGPTYGMRNQLAPEEEDLMIIEDIPDIFVSGHVHRFEMDTYKGVQLVEGSTWQSQTPFQKMMNFKPQPAKLGVVELSKANDMSRWSIT